MKRALLSVVTLFAVLSSLAFGQPETVPRELALRLLGIYGEQNGNFMSVVCLLLTAALSSCLFPKRRASWGV